MPIAQAESADFPAAVKPKPWGELSLVDVYDRYFYYKIARSPEELERVHALRYHVYCEETGFLDPKENPGGLERDVYDEHSAQSLLYHRPTGQAVGTVRVVLPKPEEPFCHLPAREHAPALAELDRRTLPWETTGEISRFAIAAEFRQRSGDGFYPGLSETGSVDPRRIIPHMTLGLMTSILETTIAFNLTHLCAIVDPALLHLMRKLGLEFEKVGPTVDFHGPRQPVFQTCHNLLNGLYRAHPEIYDVVSKRGAFSLSSS